jgi:predicted TPR repeat methyltransferase
MAQSFLNVVYNVKGADATRDLYEAWSQSYDSEVAQNAYATPGRAAEALANTIDDHTLPILDFDCGTRLSGLALKLAGFTKIDGVDLSANMLEQAKAKGIYRSLSQTGADEPLPDTSNHTAITAIGGDYGEHLPGLNMNSVVYVPQKT